MKKMKKGREGENYGELKKYIILCCIRVTLSHCIYVFIVVFLTTSKWVA